LAPLTAASIAAKASAMVNVCSGSCMPSGSGSGGSRTTGMEAAESVGTVEP
jgi:hypothetical protein